MTKKLLYSFLLFLFFGGPPAIAQYSINAGANSASGETINMDYTIGQAIVYTVSNSEWVLIAGIQQEYEIYVDTRANEVLLDIDISLYPNPAVHYINLKFGENPEREYEVVFYTASGQQVKRLLVSGLLTQIEVSDMPSGTYILQIKDGEAVIKMFKVIKK